MVMAEGVEDAVEVYQRGDEHHAKVPAKVSAEYLVLGFR